MSRPSASYFFLIICAFVFLYVAQADYFVVDEVYHLDQVQSLVKGNDQHIPSVTTFIYLHQAYAWLGQQLNINDLFAYRWINLFFALALALYIYWLSLRKENPPDWKLGAQLFFLPIVFPYYSLVYTDVIALLFLLLCGQMMTDRRYLMSAVFGGLAVLIRQPSLIWLGFIGLMAFHHLYSVRKQTFIKTCLALFPYIVIAVGFVIFFVLHNSVAIGDKGHHPISLNLTNIYFMALVACLVFLPIIISRMGVAWQLLKNKFWWWGLMVILLPVYLMTFDVTHEFNAPDYNQFIRNWLLNSLNASLLFKGLVYFFCFIGISILSTIRMRQHHHQLIYLALPLSVLPMPLIEQRYYMVGFTLWLLWRERLDSLSEVVLLIWLVLWSVLIYLGVANQWFYF